MTSEIALMNRHAIALAADSAVTVSYWKDKEHKERYFKGANKIFNLSATEPIALMVYDSADLQGMPWEVIAKAYRNHLGTTKLKRLSDYADHFFRFLEGNQAIHPPEVRLARFLSDAQRSASFMLFLLDRDNQILNLPKDTKSEERKALAGPKWAKIKKKIDAGNFIGGSSQAEVEQIISNHRKELRESFASYPIVQLYTDVVDLDDLASTAVMAMFKYRHTTLDTSGIVVAGFGEDDYFPRLLAFKHYGMILDRTLCERERDLQINHENTSEVLPFAQSEMAKTFIDGMSDGALNEIEGAHYRALEKLEADLRQMGVLAEGVDIQSSLAATTEAFSEALIGSLMRSHTEPMKRVVGMLPIDELAGLAEVLIRIESLKERVTRESEQVSGPIDVAVISKGDGFIWIKRKHYFSRELNPRYFSCHEAIRND